MKNIGSIIRYVVMLCFFLGAAACAYWLVDLSLREVRLERALAHLGTPEEKTQGALDDLLSSVTFGWLGDSSREQKIKLLLARSESNLTQLRHLGIGLGSAMAGYLFLVWLLGRRGQPYWTRWWLLQLHGCAALCLCIGLFAPMLTLVAQREVPLLGEVVLQFDSKSILTTVSKLQQSDNLPIAILLGVFSVLIPLLKLLGAFFVLLGANRISAGLVLKFNKWLGRWSMTDVFVVAILLAFLAGGASDLTKASLGLGAYFFAGYALLSLFGGHALMTWLQGRAEQEP